MLNGMCVAFVAETKSLLYLTLESVLPGIAIYRQSGDLESRLATRKMPLVTGDKLENYKITWQQNWWKFFLKKFKISSFSIFICYCQLTIPFSTTTSLQHTASNLEKQLIFLVTILWSWVFLPNRLLLALFSSLSVLCLRDWEKLDTLFLSQN